MTSGTSVNPVSWLRLATSDKTQQNQGKAGHRQWLKTFPIQALRVGSETGSTMPPSRSQPPWLLTYECTWLSERRHDIRAGLNPGNHRSLLAGVQVWLSCKSFPSQKNIEQGQMDRSHRTTFASHENRPRTVHIAGSPRV